MDQLNILGKRKQLDEYFTFQDISKLKGLYRACLVNDVKKIARRLENLSPGLFEEIRIKYQPLGTPENHLDDNLLDTVDHDPDRIIRTIHDISFKVFQQLDLLTKQMVLSKYQMENEQPWAHIHLKSFMPQDLSLLFPCMIYAAEYSTILRDVQIWRNNSSSVPPRLLDVAIKYIARFLCDRTKDKLQIPVSDPKFPEPLAFLQSSRLQKDCIRNVNADLAEVRGTIFLWETAEIDEIKAEARENGLSWTDVVNHKPTLDILSGHTTADVDRKKECLKDKLDGILDTVDRLREFLNDEAQTTLDLDKLYLDSFPDVWGCEPFVSRLVHLNLADNSLDELSDDIAKLKNLKTVDLSDSAFLTVPISLTQIDSLEEINLEWNCSIAELPDELFNLVSLKTLNLSSTCISELPPKIVQLKQLKTLILRGTDLTELPDYLADLPALTAIIIDESPASSESKIDRVSLKLLDMRADCTLDFSGIHVPKEFFDEWQKRKASGDYRGPNIIY